MVPPAGGLEGSQVLEGELLQVIGPVSPAPTESQRQCEFLEGESPGLEFKVHVKTKVIV